VCPCAAEHMCGRAHVQPSPCAAEHMCNFAGRGGGVGARAAESMCNLAGRWGGSGGLPRQPPSEVASFRRRRAPPFLRSFREHMCNIAGSGEEFGGSPPDNPLACPLPPQKSTSFFALVSLACLIRSRARFARALNTLARSIRSRARFARALARTCADPPRRPCFPQRAQGKSEGLAWRSSGPSPCYTV
jgi:hypothetical protein